MVKLTAEYIERKCSQNQLQKSLSKQLKRKELCNLTHLRLNNQFITSIGNLGLYKNVRVIYLQNNNIQKIENLHFAINLTHLYLQRNAITKMENLESLKNLQVLNLGYNNISVLEGLNGLKNLNALHLENQKITESLCFDPRSMDAISRSLKVLNISGNNIRSLKGVDSLRALEVLDARDNCIEDIEHLTECINATLSLRELNIENNPITSRQRYRENLIANNDTLQYINGKLVSETCRSFLKKFKREKHLRRTKKPSKVAFDEDITESLNLPPAFKKSISRAIFQNSGPKFSITFSPIIEDIQPRLFPPWKLASGTSTTRGKHITPRPFWNNVFKRKSNEAVHSFVKTKAIPLPPIQ